MVQRAAADGGSDHGFGGSPETGPGGKMLCLWLDNWVASMYSDTSLLFYASGEAFDKLGAFLCEWRSL